MRKIRDVLRLTHALGMSRRLVGEATGIGKTAVGEYVRRAAVAGLSWPIPDEIDDAELERRLFPPPDAASSTSRTEPDWSHNHAELKRRGVTLALLWQEYRAEHAQGYAYSWFCERYSDWRKRISPTMRQTHLAGEKLFADWAGDTMPVFDATTGEEHLARIFVAALGASNYTYAEARWTETLPYQSDHQGDGRRGGLEQVVIMQLSGHSMRVGAVQDMMASGIGILPVMQAGGWRSMNIVGRYVQEASVSQNGIAQLSGRNR
jgi:hypothetical protein